jgi:hypothetical protein
MVDKYKINFRTPGLLVKLLHDNSTVKTPCEFFIEAEHLSSIEDTIKLNKISNYGITPVLKEGE